MEVSSSPCSREARSPAPIESFAISTCNRPARRLPIPAARHARSTRTVHEWAIVSAGLAPVLLTGAYLLADILQRASYSPMRQTISAMAGQAGTDRWIMTSGIFLVGGCYLVTAAGLTGVRASARILLIVAGLAGLGIAASPEPAIGSTPRHLAWTVLGAVTNAVWPAFAAQRTRPRPWALSVYGSTAVTIVFVALLGWLVIETHGGSVLGLAERLTSSVQTSWPFAVAVALRRTRTLDVPAGPIQRRKRNSLPVPYARRRASRPASVRRGGQRPAGRSSRGRTCSLVNF
jgi:hypothetical membrane protein